MIAPPGTTSENMQRALIYSIAALEATSAMEINLNDEDRAFLDNERTALLNTLESLTTADRTLKEHVSREVLKCQAFVVVGDSALDQAIRDAKKRMKLELGKRNEDLADHIFGRNIEDLVEAELRKEPYLVLDCIARFDQVPDFAGKEELKNSLESRARKQIEVLERRDEAERKRSQLSGAIIRLVADSSDALYGLEKRLLDRFKRERRFVNRLFLDFGETKRKKANEEAAK
jgi:hypothetical protein